MGIAEECEGQRENGEKAREGTQEGGSKRVSECANAIRIRTRVHMTVVRRPKCG